MHARLATLSDAAAIAPIYNEGISERRATFETQARTEHDVRGWFDGAHPIVVVEEDSAGVVGFAATSAYRARECYAGVAEFKVYVLRAMRGRGVGKLAMQELLGRARAAGFWKLVSRVFVQNEASRALLRTLGFREVGTYFRHAKLDGAWRDVVIIEKFLAPVTEAARPSPFQPKRTAVLEAFRSENAGTRMKAFADACQLFASEAGPDPELLSVAVDAFATGKGADPNVRGFFVRLLRAYASLSQEAAQDVYASLFTRLRTLSVGPDREAFYEVAFVIKQTMGSGGSHARPPEPREYLADLRGWLREAIDLPHDLRARISPANLTSLLLSLALALSTTEEEKSDVASLVPEAMARHRVAPPPSIRPPASIFPPQPIPPVEDVAPAPKRRAPVVKTKVAKKIRKAKPRSRS
jgi:L-amino acid N-acyltransferase YncA